MIKCNKCGVEQPESNFYYGRKYYKNVVYVHYYKVCKSCISKRAKARADEKKEAIKEELKKIAESSKDKWIVRNLKRYGNCYIKYKEDHNLEELKTIYNIDYELQPAGDMLGFIIQVKR